MFGDWKLEAGRGGLGMLEAGCILVSGVRDDPGSKLGHGLSFGAGAMEPSWARGPGRGGRAGSRRFREIRGSPSPGPWPLYPPTLLGWAARIGARGGGGSAAGLLFVPGQIFFCLALCLPSSLPFCRLFAAGRPRPAPFWSG